MISTTLHYIPHVKFKGLSKTKLIFLDFQGPGKKRKITGALKALGYLAGSNGNGSPPPVQQHQHIHVDATLLAQARERAAGNFAPPTNGTPREEQRS